MSGRITACVWVALLALGCQKNGDLSGPPATAVRHPILEDIPQPAGFRLVDERSVSRNSGQFRVAKVEFIGDASRASVYRFYKEYMPSAGFHLVQENFERGQYNLQFRADSEELYVRIRPEGSKTAVALDLGPTPRATPKREPYPQADQARARK